MKDFFISYNKADRSWAEWIAWELEEGGYSVVIQAWDFRPGSNFVLEMNEGLKEAERMIAVLSPDYVMSRFTAPEWAAAFARDSTGSDRKLIPVRVRDADLSGLLAQIVYIDFVGVTEETVTRKLLLEGVLQGRAKPIHKPSFPGAPSGVTKERPRFPGARPPIWNVPHNRNRNFTGREELLSTLRTLLQAGHRSALTALHGLGGIGKTQTAVEYTYRYVGEYDLVWWVRSEDLSTLKSDYALLAAALELPEAETDQQAATEAVKAWLGTIHGWLLVFDNALAPEEIQPYLPVGSSGHVIITSRNPDWRTIAEPLQVRTLSTEDAVEFLHRRSGQKDQLASRELVEDLGRLPLAIEQAAAYIDVHSKPIPEYLNLFRKHRQKLLKRGQPTAYPDTVETTWELSFKEVEHRSPAGAALLSVCAFLAPDDIPLDVITAGSDLMPEPLASAVRDELEFDAAVYALLRYSLIDLSQGALSVHRLVQAVVRDRMEKSEKEVWAESAAGVIRQVFPMDGDDVRTWPICARLLPHAAMVAQHCEEEKAGSEFAADLLSQSAQYLHARAELAEAKSLNQRALKIDEAAHGPDHPNVANHVSNLGSVLQDLGDLHGAREHFERALQINEKSYGPDHPTVAIRLNNLGGVFQTLGDLQEARHRFLRALEINESSYGPKDPNVAINLNNLGRVLQDLGNLEEARYHFERALMIDEVSYGPDHPKVAIRINNLGGVFRALGDLQEARNHFERALEIDEASYGPEHPKVAIRLNNIGDVLQGLGDLHEARPYLERALKIEESTYGCDHPSVAHAVNNLGRVLQKLGDFEEARKHFERALKITETSFGPNHPYAGISANNLGMVLEELGDLENARAHLTSALKVDVLSHEPLNVAYTLHNLSRVLYGLGDLEEARKHLVSALKILDAELGAEHPSTTLARNDLDALPLTSNDVRAR